MAGSPTVGELFAHMDYVRLIFIQEDTPEFVGEMPEKEWAPDHDRERMAQRLNHSARAVREAVKSRVETRREMDVHYDHPILFLQHMIWHEGYHHGQIRLALKLTGQAITTEQAGPISWRVWMNKKTKSPASQ
jgi:uncharacterized damage-inducible protein DinB